MLYAVGFHRKVSATNLLYNEMVIVNFYLVLRKGSCFNYLEQKLFSNPILFH